MKKPNIYTSINIEEELNSVVLFLKETWSFPSSLSEEDIFNFVKEPFYTGLNITRNSYPVSDLSRFVRKELKKPHSKYEKNNFQEFYFYDGL